MKEPLKTLIVEDNLADAELLVLDLKRGGFDPAFERVDRPERFAGALSAQSWDIIFSDYAMPHFSGPAALEMWRGSGIDIPFIVISGTIGEEIAVEMLKAGASDYLLKNNRVRLIPAVRKELAEVENRQKRREAERQLLVAKEAAEAANKRKSEFLARMSHELRTPLNAIIAYSQILEMGKAGPINDRQRQFLHNIGVSGQHLLNIVNDLLDVSRVETGKLTIMPEFTDIGPIVATVRDVMQTMAQEKSINLTFDVQEDPGGVNADPTRLKQVLINLIGNAIKFNHPGQDVRVRIFKTEDRQWLVGEVEDTGPGIPNDKLPELFQEFYQLDTSAARRHEGVGLGLALVKNLVELHGGTIDVHSQEGVGTLFSFRLPVSTREP
jgi:two-component system sensor histidine kinase EvgS